MIKNEKSLQKRKLISGGGHVYIFFWGLFFGLGFLVPTLIIYNPVTGSNHRQSFIYIGVYTVIFSKASETTLYLPSRSRSSPSSWQLTSRPEVWTSPTSVPSLTSTLQGTLSVHIRLSYLFHEKIKK